MKKVKWKILAVEDGSVDIEALNRFLEENNMPIYPLVYRQGSMPPRFIEETEQN